jgi:nucleoside-diphosphate-sugar epimerase
MAKLVCGCGYLGFRVARRWVARGESVWATTRSADRARELTAAGIHAIVVDVTQSFALPVGLAGLDAVLFALGFDRSAHQTLEEVYERSLANVLGALPHTIKRFIYISSTGVYGQHDGSWVDEDSECRPTRAGGRACLSAERRIAHSPFHGCRIVLRLAGIYGPGRIPKLAAVQRGEPIGSVESSCLNLIHIDDAADVVVAVEQRVQPPQTLLVADGCPVSRGDFYRELARILHAPSPQFALADDARYLAERRDGDKRVSNRRLRELVGMPLTYPSYREGLAATVVAAAG